MNTIAIDCGASFIKSALFHDEVLVCSEQKAAPLVGKTADIFHTKRIEVLVEIVRGCVDRLSAHEQEFSLCVDNEMHGCILAYADGTPFTDYISWQYELIPRDVVWQHLVQSAGEEKADEIIKKTGMPLRSGLPCSTLFWMNQNKYLEGHGKLCFYTLGDYIIKRITNIEPLCHPTNAAATGLYDLELGNWNHEYIALLTGGADIFFPPVGSQVCNVTYGDKVVRVLPAIGDQQAALLGSGFCKASELSFNMGTGAQVARLLKGTLQYGDYQIRPYFYGCCLKTIPHVPSGRALNVFFRFVKSICQMANTQMDDTEIWDMIQEAVSLEDGTKSSLRCDLSFFENALTDHTNGSICEISEYGLTLGALFKSVFHQMIENFVIVADRVNAGLPEYNSILFSGGIARRWKILRQGIVDELDSGANVVVSEHDTLYGCMRYAMMDDGDR